MSLTHIDLVVRVLSENDVISPVSGLAAAFVHVELLEGTTSLGEVIFGDLVRFAAEDLKLEVVVRRARMRFVSVRGPGTPVSRAVPELVPLLRRARGGFDIVQREHRIEKGDRLRLRAAVEAHPTGLSVRDDVAPVLLEEVVFALPGLPAR